MFMRSYAHLLNRALKLDKCLTSCYISDLQTTAVGPEQEESMDEGIQVLSKHEADLELPNLDRIDPEKIDNPTLRAALERIRDHRNPSHASHHTQHTSHSSYASGW
jgi:hypothetical protein